MGDGAEVVVGRRHARRYVLMSWTCSAARFYWSRTSCRPSLCFVVFQFVCCLRYCVGCWRSRQ